MELWESKSKYTREHGGNAHSEGAVEVRPVSMIACVSSAVFSGPGAGVIALSCSDRFYSLPGEFIVLS